LFPRVSQLADMPDHEKERRVSMLENEDKWLRWVREIQSLGQTGLFYAKNHFEQERAQRLIEIAAMILSEYSDITVTEALVAFTAQPGYVTPKVDVRAAVFDSDRILLVQEAHDGCWTLPGGWADVGETPRTAIEREVLEEAGLEVQVKRLIGVYDANRIEDSISIFHAYKLLFLCEVLSGALTPSVETTSVDFFPVDQLPQPFSSHRTAPRHITDALKARDDPAWQAVFD
jgi:ADP-ribose pyrophosphatase YjhB (NUDIX family)